MLRVMRNHRRAAHGESAGYEGLATSPCRSTMRRLRLERDGRASPTTPGPPGTRRSRSASEHGYRNAQATVIAPTGTIGLVMDCDTTGIEPDFALVKFKKLAGGGYFKIINRAVPEALRTLGYRESEIAEIEAYAVGHGSLGAGARHQPRPRSRRKGFTEEKIDVVEKALPSAFDIKFVFNKWTLGEDFLTGALGVPAEKLADPAFDLLAASRLLEGATSRPRTSMSAAR